MLAAEAAVGLVAAQRNPGVVKIYDSTMHLTGVIDLTDLVPSADSAVLSMGPDGLPMVRGSRVMEITGVVPLGSWGLLLSLFRPDSYDAILVTIHISEGTRHIKRMPDPVEVLGCAFAGHIVLRQFVDAEYIVIYRVLEPTGVCDDPRGPG